MFHGNIVYWGSFMSFFSIKNVFKTQNLVVMALMVALKAVLSSFAIYITPTFRIFSFTYLPGAMVALLYGPWAGIVFGFASDFIGYFVHPMGPYLPVYAFSEMVANFIYALFLYRRPLVVWRTVLAQITVVIVVIFGMGYLWNWLLYGAVATSFFTGARFLSNLINTPVYVFLIMVMGKVCLRVTKQPGNI